ncbi:Uncharacterized protein OS=Candidatus Entotheonella sp. TSY2 GN=ETSY2_30415 PE=4 SV=1: DUF4058 [Gemmataceae bacterium]|nr:Uncharacterized protein OS=Candidatus Entotheonella sp. TSY2 GN=ETSY2_30415 PE=4 SV=1: DUF4058 [Gemmataceae bacterium]VTU00793.1 Uncharacterized protein OS=Candidatus Entotheonella sp. TSY2 GN=ETSY2_30415 PE=4 SV=1: DUF4058 [Gemmataceae bacterium]
MPIHDWTRVEPGDYHHFHQRWISAISDALNTGGLPPGFMAMAEQVTGRPIPDVVALQTNGSHKHPGPGGSGGVAVAVAPPTAHTVTRFASTRYSDRANRVVIRHGRGKVVAIIELVSPGNKDSKSAVRTFVEKAVDILRQGVHMLVVDLFPPTPRDPQGLNKLILDEFGTNTFEPPPGKPLSAAAYLAGDDPTAYLEPLAVGDALPALPIFLTEDVYVPAPLEATYAESWAVYPQLLRDLVAPPG